MEEIIKSARITDDKSGTVYELDFSRESIVFAERQGFSLDNAVEHPVSGMRDLFYIAFRMHHRTVSREKTDKLIERWGGGIPEQLAKRLIQLYRQAESSYSILREEETEKNSGLTVEL